MRARERERVREKQRERHFDNGTPVTDKPGCLGNPMMLLPRRTVHTSYRDEEKGTSNTFIGEVYIRARVSSLSLSLYVYICDPMYVYLSENKGRKRKIYAQQTPPLQPPLVSNQNLVSAAATIITKSTPYSSNNQNCLSHADTL